MIKNLNERTVIIQRNKQIFNAGNFCLGTPKDFSKAKQSCKNQLKIVLIYINCKTVLLILKQQLKHLYVYRIHKRRGMLQHARKVSKMLSITITLQTFSCTQPEEHHNNHQSCTKPQYHANNKHSVQFSTGPIPH